MSMGDVSFILFELHPSGLHWTGAGSLNRVAINAEHITAILDGCGGDDAHFSVRADGQWFVVKGTPDSLFESMVGSADVPLTHSYGGDA